MTVREKADEILGRLTKELDAIDCEYQIMYGIRSEPETFGAMCFSDKFNVYRAIDSLKKTLAATEKLKEELEADSKAGKGIFAKKTVQ